MKKTGKRPVGRPALGITKKVSLTLTAEEWEKIESSGQPTIAAYVRQLMKDGQRKEADMIPLLQERIREWENRYALLEKEIRDLQAEQNISNLKSNMTRAQVEERWEIYLSSNKHTPEAIEQARQAMFRILFPGSSDTAQVKTKTQYECPFTGKRFGSMESLVKAAIPHLIKSAETELQHKKELALVREREKGPRYFDQL